MRKCRIVSNALHEIIAFFLKCAITIAGSNCYAFVGNYKYYSIKLTLQNTESQDRKVAID